MAENLSFTWELKGQVEQQIKNATKDTEKLADAIKALNVDLSKLSAEKIQQNLTKNVNDAEKALYKLMETKDKVDKALSRNADMRSKGFLGIDETRLTQIASRIDDIINKIMNIGAEANFSRNAVKDLLASLSSDIAMKEAKNATSVMDKGLDKQVRERAKAAKEAAKEMIAAEKDADKAAANNVKNQEKVKDALSRIATARANLSAASDSASLQDQMHARLLMSLLDRLRDKLGALRNEFLGEKGVLDHVLGSGYQGLMRNVNTAIRNALNGGGVSDEQWEKMQQEAEAHRQASQAAEVHKQKLNELTSAFDRLSQEEARESAQQERAKTRQESYYQSQQKASQATRQRAEELVRLRMELLKTQATELQNLMKSGKDLFSAAQYEEVRNALRQVREEMRQLAGVMQSMGSYSTRDLLGFGRGTQNWSPLIQNGQQLLATQNAVRQLSMEEENLRASLEKANNAFNNQSRILGDLQAMTYNYVSLWGARDFINNIIQIGGQLEMQRLSIAAILGDAAHANDLFERIKDLAVQSPFGVVELDQYTKQLSAYGFKYNELYDMTKRLADISAGAGTDVGRLALALGHVRSEAALSGYTLRQFAMNNIPMVGELSRLLSEVEKKQVSVADVRKRVRNKEISYEDVETVIKRLTDEGGRFYNMQEVISESVKARFKNLKDSLDIMYGEIAESNVGDSLKEIASVLTNLTRHWKELFAIMQSGLIVLGSYKAMMITNTLLLGKQNAAVEASAKLEQRRLKAASSYRTLTAAEQAFIGVRGKALIQADALALSEKKLTAEHLARQVALGKLTKAEAMQAIKASTLLSYQKEEARVVVSNVYTYGRFTGVVNRLTIGLQGLGMALKSLVWNPLTAIFAGVGVITHIWQKHNDEVERAKELNESMFNRAAEGIKNIRQMMEETSMAFTINGKVADFSDLENLKNGKFEFPDVATLTTKDIISAMDAWTEFIKEYADNPKSLLNEAFMDNHTKQVRELTDQYTLLGNTVADVVESYTYLASVNGAVEFAMNETGGWINDDLIKNISDYSEKYKEFNNAISKSVKNNKEFWTATMKGARLSLNFMDELTGKGVKMEDLNTQIRILLENQDKYKNAIEEAEKAANKYGVELTTFDTSIDYNLGFGRNTLQDYFQSMSDARQTMLNDMASFAESLKSELTQQGWDFEHLTKGQIQAVGLAISEVVSKTKNGTDEIHKEVINLMRQKMNIPITVDTEEAVRKVIGLKQSLHDLVYGDDKNKEWTIKIDAAADFSDVISDVRKAYKSAKDFISNTEPLQLQFGINTKGGMKTLGIVQRGALIQDWKKKNPGKDSTLYEQFLEQWDTMAQAMSDAEGFSKATGISLEDKKKGGKGSKEDKLLKQWREELKELQEFWREYESLIKRMSSDAAINEIRNGGVFPQLFDNDKLKVDVRAGLGKALDDLLAKTNASTTERQSLQVDIKKARFNVSQKDSQEAADALFKQLEEELNRQGKKWDLYKKVLDATGNKEQAGQIAFGGGVRFDNYAEELRSRIEKELEKLPSAKGISVDKLLGMDSKALENIGIFEKSNIVPMLKELKEVEQRLKSDDVDLLINAYKNAKSLETELAQIKVKFDNIRRVIAGAENHSPEEKKKLTENANNEQALEEAATKWEWFKKNNADWGVIFGNLEKASTKALRKMKADLEKQAPAIREDVKATKELYEAIEKIDNLLVKRNPFKAMGDSFSKIANLKEILNGATNTNGMYSIGDEKAMSLGLKVNDKAEYSSKEIREALKAAGKDFEAGAMLFVDNVNSLPDLVDAVGLSNTEFGEGVKEFADGTNHFANAIKNWSNGNYVGAITEGIKGLQSYGNLVERIGGFSFNGSNEDEINSTIADLSAVNERLSNRIKELTDKIGSSAGIKAINASNTALKLQKEREDNIRKMISAKMDYHASHHSFGSYWNGFTKEELDLINDQLEVWEQFDGDLRNLTANQAKAIVNSEELRSKIANTGESYYGEAVLDYIEMLADEAGEAEEITKRIQDNLTQTSFEGMRDSFLDALLDMEKSAKDFANDIKKIMYKALVNSLVLNDDFDAWLNNWLKDYASAVENDDTAGINRLNQQAEEEYARRQQLAERYANALGLSSGSSSSSSGIKGVTEQTADLIASYINQIRADVSVNRATLQQILAQMIADVSSNAPSLNRSASSAPSISEAQQYAEAAGLTDGLTSIAQAQLEQLRLIVGNTGRNVDLVQEVRDMLHRVTLGGDAVKVK